MLINTTALRDYMTDYCGTAAFAGFPAAMLGVIDIESMSDRELCKKAESMGVDLQQFVIDDELGGNWV